MAAKRGICLVTVRKSRAARGAEAVGRDFIRFGAKLENVSVGCCGMAGTYGHEVKTMPTRWISTRFPSATGDPAFTAQTVALGDRIFLS